MRNFPRTATGFAILVFTVITSVYLATYFVSVNDRTFMIVAANPSHSIADDDLIVPTYRFGGEVAKSFFSYAHRVDRILRRGYWRP